MGEASTTGRSEGALLSLSCETAVLSVRCRWGQVQGARPLYLVYPNAVAMFSLGNRFVCFFYFPVAGGVRSCQPGANPWCVSILACAVTVACPCCYLNAISWAKRPEDHQPSLGEQKIRTKKVETTGLARLREGVVHLS